MWSANVNNNRNVLYLYDIQSRSELKIMETRSDSKSEEIIDSMYSTDCDVIQNVDVWWFPTEN